MKKILFFSAVLGMILVGLVSCSGKNSPTAPSSSSSSNPTATPTVTGTPTPIPGIYLKNAEVYRYNGSNYASVNLTVNGQAVTTVSLVVTGLALSAPVTIPYTGTNTVGGITYATYFVTNSNLNYTPGDSVTLTAISGSVTATASAALPGGITNAANGSQANWVISSASAQVSVSGPGVTFVSPSNLSSPYNVPATVYANGGVFTMTTTISYTNSAVTGAASGSQFTVYDQLSTTVLVNTPTPTVTSTITPTATATAVPGIYWENAGIDRINNEGTVNQYAQVLLTVNGLPSNSVNVVVSGPGVTSPVTLAYIGTSSPGGVLCANYLASTGFTYQPGLNYILTTTSGALTAAATLTAPGNITNAADGSQASWSASGSNAVVYVENSSNVYAYRSSTYFPLNNLTPPFNVPVTAYAGGGNFTLTTSVYTGDSSITGAVAGSYFQVEDSLTTLVTVNTPTTTPTPLLSYTPTNTSTGTPTITNTFTATNSPTVTLTYTATATPTQTSTITATNSATTTYTATQTGTILTSTPTLTATPPPRSVYYIGSSGAAYDGIQYDGNGNVWVADSTNNALQKWTTAGVGPSLNITTFNGSDTFNTPIGLGLDSTTGNAYVADYVHSRIVVFSSTGTYLTTFANAQISSFVTGVAVNSSGTMVCVSNPGNANILKYSIGGTSSSPTFSYLNAISSSATTQPYGLAFDSSNNLWVANQTGAVVEFNASSGVTLASFNVAGAEPAYDVVVDGSGNIFVGCNPHTQEFNSSHQLINEWSLYALGVSLDKTNDILYEVTSGANISGYQVQ